MTSRIFNETIYLIHQLHGEKLQTLHQLWVNADIPAAAVRKHGHLSNYIGFLDGACKWHNSNAWVVIGGKHDSFLLYNSPLLPQLAAMPTLADGQQVILYGNLGYPDLAQLSQLHRHIPKQPPLTPGQLDENEITKMMGLVTVKCTIRK